MNVRWMSVAFGAVLLGGTVQAHQSRVYRLIYSAPAECPDRAVFSSAVQSNSARIRHALAGETAVTVEATVSATNDEFEGKLEIRHPDGTETSRSVPGASCAETVDAMALIVTLTLDPDAREPPLFEEIEPAEPAVTKSLPPTPYDSEYPADVTGSVSPPNVGADAAPSKGPGAARTSERSWRFRPSASFGVTSANGPELSPEYGVGLGLTTGSNPLSPYLVLSGHFADSGVVAGDTQAPRFTRGVARLSACPALAHSGVLVLRSCLFLGVGELRVEGLSYPGYSARMPWLEWGAKLRGEAKAGPLIVGAEFGAALLGVRTYFEVPLAQASAALDMGLEI